MRIKQLGAGLGLMLMLVGTGAAMADRRDSDYYRDRRAVSVIRA